MTNIVEYPTDGTYQLKVKTVNAIFFDGSKASAHEVLAWVYRRNGEGALQTNDSTYSEGNFILRIDGITGIIPSDSWIVQLRRLEFFCMNDVEFKETYEPVPKPLPFPVQHPRDGGDSGGIFTRTTNG